MTVNDDRTWDELRPVALSNEPAEPRCSGHVLRRTEREYHVPKITAYGNSRRAEPR